jgi:D-alanine-D-alanine ligase
MVECFAYGDVALVQRHVAGVEVAVSVVDLERAPRALPAVEIVPDGGFYGYDARYVAGATEFFCPARLTAETSAAVARAALTAHEAFGLRHLSRTDLIVDADGVPWFLEVNVAPGMTETSLLPQAVEAAGEDAAALYRSIVERALAEDVVRA